VTDFCVGLFVQVALLFLAFKIWRKAKARERAGKTKWRRRMGLLLFVAPFLLWIAGLILPEVLQGPVKFFTALTDGLDKWIGFTIGSAESQLDKRNIGALFQLSVKPIVHAVVYGGLGVLIGWPMDTLRKEPEEEPETETPS
jgi:hypothetical protein